MWIVSFASEWIDAMIATYCLPLFAVLSCVFVRRCRSIIVLVEVASGGYR